MVPEGFINFTDVQVAGSMIWSFVFIGFALGAIFADGTYFTVKFLIKKFKKKGAKDA